MLTYLIERENEQMLRTSKRTLEFPDGETRTLETYRVVWNWFDRIVANQYAMSQDKILEMTVMWAEGKSVSLDDALAQIIECAVKECDRCDWDLTDDTLALTMARQGVESFYLRKKLGLRRPKKIAISRSLQEKLKKNTN